MSSSAEESRFEVKKDRILKAAAYCFNQKGYAGTSLKDVADMLGLTDPALYYYVRNKEELVYFCYLRAIEVGQQAMRQATTNGNSGLEKILRYIENHVSLMVGEQGPVAIVSDIPSLEPEHREEILALSREHSNAFESLLHEGIEDGSITDCNVRMTGNAIMGSINWIPKWFHGDKDVARELIDEFPKILTAGLRVASDRLNDPPNDRPPG